MKKARYYIQEDRDELRVSIVNSETGEPYIDYEYDDSSERVHQLMNARRECAELNGGRA